MRRGCIVVGDVRCGGCGRTIKHPERYLIMDEETGKEAAEETMIQNYRTKTVFRKMKYWISEQCKK